MLHRDAAKYVRACIVCHVHDPLLHATLYHTMGISKYAQHIFDYLTSSTISDQPNKKKRLVILESQWYRIIGKQLYRIGPDGNLRLCVPEDCYLEVLFHEHSGSRSRHFSANVIAKAIMRVGLWWPTLHKDAIEYVKH